MGVFYAGTVGRNEFFYKIRWPEKSILALEPKFHGDLCKNTHATKRKSEKKVFNPVFSQKWPSILNFGNKLLNPHIKLALSIYLNVLGH